jgi:hypothetical protein
MERPVIEHALHSGSRTSQVVLYSVPSFPGEHYVFFSVLGRISNRTEHIWYLGAGEATEASL